MNNLYNPMQLLSDVLGDAVYSKRFTEPERFVKNSAEWLKLTVEECKDLKSSTHKTHPHLWRKVVDNVTLYDIKIIGFFPQTWSSTCTAHDGPNVVAGQAITEAYTVVLNYNNEYVIYVNGGYCYKLKNPNNSFFEDLGARKMKSRSKHKSYQKE